MTGAMEAGLHEEAAELAERLAIDPLLRLHVAQEVVFARRIIASLQAEIDVERRRTDTAVALSSSSPGPGPMVRVAMRTLPAVLHFLAGMVGFAVLLILLGFVDPW